MTVSATSECRSDAPYITWDFSDHTVSSVTMTYELGTGGTADITGLSPIGEMLYPGAEVDGSGVAVAWPGWTQNSDGSWSGPDAYKPGDGKRGMNVTFTATGNSQGLSLVAAQQDLSASTFIDYPPATPGCNPNPSTEPTPSPTTPVPSTSTGSTSAGGGTPTSSGGTNSGGGQTSASGEGQNNAVLPRTGAGNAAGVGLVGLLFIAAGAWVVRLARRPRSH